MATLLSSSAAAAPTAPTTVLTFSAKPPSSQQPRFLSLTVKTTPRSLSIPVSTFSPSVSRAVSAETSSTLTSSPTTVPFGENGSSYGNRHWMVLVEPPSQQLTTRSRIIDYYVSKLERLLGSKTEAQMCMYDASCHTHFGFCCDIDEETAHALASLPGVLSVKPDPDFNSTHKDYSSLMFELNTESNSPSNGSTLLFPAGTTKRWLVRTSRPAIGAIRKAQVVDYYVRVLMRVLRNEKDAQMCMYHVSWESNFGFCCELDDECARELAGPPSILLSSLILFGLPGVTMDSFVLAAVPGVLSVEQDQNFGSDEKDYGGEKSRASGDSSVMTQTSNIKTKKLFVTGLSFYTSEKTLRSAFEGFGELVEVNIIMDKISKRSKGYAFVEYTTEEAAGTALREMNGKIINGWMITVDVAKKNPPKYSRVQRRPS